MTDFDRKSRAEFRSIIVSSDRQGRAIDWDVKMQKMRPFCNVEDVGSCQS